VRDPRASRLTLRVTRGNTQTLAAATHTPSFPAVACRPVGMVAACAPPPPPGRWQRYGALVPGHGGVSLPVGSWRGKGAGDAFRWPLCFGRAAVVSTVCPVARLCLHRQGHKCGRDSQRWVEVGRLGQIWRCLTVERRVRW
jgi:hypothetical protein